MWTSLMPGAGWLTSGSAITVASGTVWSSGTEPENVCWDASV